MSSSEPEQPRKPDYSKMLDGWLDEWYEASVLGRGKPEDTIYRFQRIASIEPMLQQAAIKRLDDIKGIPDQRCFLTKTKREFLRKVTTP